MRRHNPKSLENKWLRTLGVFLLCLFAVSSYAQSYEAIPSSTVLNGYSSDNTIVSGLTLRNAGSQHLQIDAVTLGNPTNDYWIKTSFTANSQVPPFAGTLAGTVTATTTELAAGTHTGSIVFAFVDDTPPSEVHTVTITINAGFDILFNGAQSASRWADKDELVIVNEGNSFNGQWRLRSKPNSDVTLTLSGDSSASGITISPSVITFTPSNWNTYVGVTITSNHNLVVDGDRDILMTVTTTSADALFTALTFPKYTISIKDNDTPGIFVTQTTFAITEGSPGLTFSINMQTLPSASVDITFVSHPQFTITPATATFTTETPQTFTILATNDNVIEGTMVLTRTLGTVTSADSVYGAFTLPTISITITDDDLVVLDISPRTGPEDGATEVLVHLGGAVTLDMTSVSYPGFTLINAQENPGHTWAGSSSDEFLRNIVCIWGSHANAPSTGAFVQGPRTLKCLSPPCSLNTIDTFKRCFSPLDVRLSSNGQIAPSPYPQFYYYWSPQHDVITPENRDDEVWRSTILSVAPTTGPMHLETRITIKGSHFAVDTVRREVAPPVTQTQPAVRMGGILCRGTEWVDPNDHDKGIITYTPKRKDLEGTSKTIQVRFTISFNGQNFWGEDKFTFGYNDDIRETTSLAWTLFFITVNAAFLIFFAFTLKGWLCSNFCERCRKGDDVEEEGDLDIRGPKQVSEYLEKKILERLTRDRDVLRAYRQAAEEDALLKSKLDEAGYGDAWEDEDDVAARIEEQTLAAAAVAKLAVTAEKRNVLGGNVPAHNNVSVIEMTNIGGNELSVVPSSDGHRERVSPFEIESSVSTPATSRRREKGARNR